MSTLLARSAAEGNIVHWLQEDNGRVHCVADGDVDADGANGQHGKIAAYRADGMGSELLGNGGMKRLANGKVVWAAGWGPDIVLVNSAGLPLVLPDGVIPSRTSWHDPAKGSNDPSAYADSETVPYMVVPPEVRRAAKGIVLGCRGQITHTKTGKTTPAGVLDIGPRNKAGELSIAAARALGLRSSPRDGGTDEAILRYEFFPGEAFEWDGFKFALVRG